MSRHGFNLSEEIDRYTLRITGLIKSKRTRKKVALECKDYMEDSLHRHMMEGKTQEEAFSFAREELGDEDKIRELLGSVHNHYRPFVRFRSVFLAFALALLVASYFLINNDIYRAWLIVFFQGSLLCFLSFLGYRISLFLSAVRVRKRSFKKLKNFAKAQGFGFEAKKVYASLVVRRNEPDIIIDTPQTRYIVSFFSTIRKRKTLRLFDNGLYSYSDNIGYMLLYTRNMALLGPAWGVFWPNSIKPFPTFASDMVEIPRGMHLLPKVDYEKFDICHKENRHILLLNPVPLEVYGIEKGQQRKLRDDDFFCGQYIESCSGLISYLRGEKISKINL